jgi:hypothetical protein
MVETTLNGQNRIGEFLLGEKTSFELKHKEDVVVNESTRDENFDVFSCDKNSVYTKIDDEKTEWKEVHWNWTIREQKSLLSNENNNNIEFVNFR